MLGSVCAGFGVCWVRCVLGSACAGCGVCCVRRVNGDCFVYLQGEVFIVGLVYFRVFRACARKSYFITAKYSNLKLIAVSFYGVIFS